MKLQIAAFLLALATAVQAYKILVIVPIHGKSHWNYMQVFAKELIHRGHEVTCITSMPMTGPKLNNYTEVLIDPPYDLTKWVKNEDLFQGKGNSPFYLLLMAFLFAYFTDQSTDHALSTSKVQEFIHRDDLHFDLVINEDVYHDTFLMFAHKFKAPMINMCPFGVPDMHEHDMGMITPFSHVSHTMFSYTDEMTFTQRWINVIVSVIQRIAQLVINGWQTKLAQKHFAHLEPMPTVRELRKNISVMFANAHRSITHPRPSMPGLIYIGGGHIKPPKPLPVDLAKFLDDAEHGAIYFSLGTLLNPSKMPKEQLYNFIENFRKLKQRIIWKFEDESIPNLPENVLIRKWLPQTDILAHPNIVLFISHGGMFSNFEAINYGIQLLMIPIMGDQFRNARRVEHAGYGKYLDFHTLTNETLRRSLNEMLTNHTYSNKAKEISALFRSNPIHPMDEFIWWVEHVIETRGAKYLKSSAIEMSTFTYLMLDVLLAELVVIFVISYAICYSIKRLRLRRRNRAVAKNKKQQ